MGEAIFFRNITTKGLTAINSGERYFEGWLTVQVKDKQGEVTIVDELMKVLPVWIDRGAPISDTHSNRIIGKGINYSKAVYKDVDGTEYPAIKITGKIHKNYELDNDIWSKIKSGEYKGLSFGGATKSDREPMQMKDGSIAYSLKDLEHYEVAVCRDPAVPLALITEFNTLAKAAVEGEDIGGGRMLIKCSKYGCYVDKTESKDSEYTEEEKNEMDAKEIRDQAQRVVDEDEKRLKHPMVQNIYRNNNEAGLKAPEARNEALVYDDKTLDQPSETPLENQAKVQKGRWDIPKEPNQHKTTVRNGHGNLFEAFSEDDEDYKHLSEEGKKLYHEQEAKWRKDNPDTEEVEKGQIPLGKGEGAKGGKEAKDIDNIIREIKDEDNRKDAIDRHATGDTSTLESRRKKKKVKKKSDDYIKKLNNNEKARLFNALKSLMIKLKGEDWSNAGGDMHSMYNQDTDEGGMGKHKQKGCKCGDPKCKDPKCKHKREVGTGYGAEENSTGEVGWSGGGSPYPKIVKSRLKLLKLKSQQHTEPKQLHIQDQEHHQDKDNIDSEDRDEPSKEHKTHNTETAEPDWDWEQDDEGMGIWHGIVNEDEVGLGGRPLSDKELDRITTGQKKKGYGKAQAIKRARALQDKRRAEEEKALYIAGGAREKDIVNQSKKDRKESKKDGEYGGMNTGQVEWTEPRDTANDRRDSKIKEVKETIKDMKLKSNTYIEDLEEHGRLGSKETDKDILDNIKRPYETRTGAGFLSQYKIGEGKRPTKNQVLGGHKGRGRVDLRERWHEKHPKRVKELRNDPKKEYLRREGERAFGNTDFKEREAEGKAKWGMIDIFGKAVMTNVLSRLKSMKLKARKQRKDVGTKKGPQKVTIISDRYGKGKTPIRGQKIGRKDVQGRIVSSTQPKQIKDNTGKVIASASTAEKMRLADIADTKNAKEIEQMKNGTWTGLAGSEARRARYKKDAKYRKLVDDHLSGGSDKVVRDESIDDEGTAHGAT